MLGRALGFKKIFASDVHHAISILIAFDHYGFIFTVSIIITDESLSAEERMFLSNFARKDVS